MRIPKAVGLFALVFYACSHQNEETLDSTPPSIQPKPSQAASDSAPQFGLLPTKNSLPITPDTFCAGIRNILSKAKQQLTAEADVICTGNTANQLLLQLLASPYQGGGNPQVTQLQPPNPGNENVANFVTYAMRVKKKPVATLLSEEGIIRQTNYDNQESGFKLSLGFADVPPVNEGDSDTSFLVIQQTFADQNNVNFADTSKHDLKLYIMYPNNFEFLMAGRTLVAPTEQIKYGGVLRAVMPDPKDPEYSITVSVINFVMNGRGRNEQVQDAFNTFILSDLESSYQYHLNNP